MTASQVYPSMAPLFDMFSGPVKMAVLEAAIELDLARVLEDHSDLNAIAGALGIDIDPTGLGLFLDAAVAMGMAEKKKGQYANTDFGRHFLDSNSPVFMGGLVKNMKAMQHQNLDKIIEIIKIGSPEVQRHQHLSSEAKWENAVRHLAAYQRAGMASLCADIVQDLPEFTRAEKILDLGGGPGIIGAQMLRRLPGARGVLADLPAIIRLARKEIEKEGLSHRMSFIAGDYNDTDLGSGYQIIWASHNLYYVKDRVAFFKRIKNALTPDGVFVCLHEGLTCERTAPASVVLPRLSLALEGQDVSFDKGEIAACLDRAGFARVETRMLSLPAGEGELVIARPHEKAGS
ncbi:MAG: methyltransferase domain-containing protein [Desulfobacterales bacterium]|nr:methyltransferase domain-containing protein [Desulfobacterales bacterium]